MRPLLAFFLASLGCAFAEDGPQSPPLRIPIPAAVTPFLMFEGQAQQAMEFYTARTDGTGQRQLHLPRLHVHALVLAIRHL